MFILVGLAAVAGMAENVSSFESRACTSIQFKREIEQWNNGYPEQKNQHLPNIKSFMKTIKQEPEFYTQNVMHTRPLSVEKLNVHMASHEEYQPLQDAYLEFFHQGQVTTKYILHHHQPSTNLCLCLHPHPFQHFTPPALLAFHLLHRILLCYKLPSRRNEFRHEITNFLNLPLIQIIYFQMISIHLKTILQAVPCHSNSICVNCKTRETTLWRRNHVGEIECNACNLYFRKNNRKRPLSLRKDGIMKRNRKPRCNSPAVGLFRP
uniref:GATA-type domain-containing protein n=1 Tax=Heterorhabditis bacteriophora TaxID=37862 RepID=A0A1I7W705_HETBA